jgi:hypothetical protein
MLLVVSFVHLYDVSRKCGGERFFLYYKKYEFVAEQTTTHCDTLHQIRLTPKHRHTSTRFTPLCYRRKWGFNCVFMPGGGQRPWALFAQHSHSTIPTPHLPRGNNTMRFFMLHILLYSTLLYSTRSSSY